jgi:hypothetical protein
VLKNEKIAVIFLMWIPYGIGYFKRFLHSYCCFPAEHPHKLVLLFNGVSSPEECEEYVGYARKIIPDFDMLQMKSGQDIDAYFFAASNRPEEYLFFLNTFCEFRTSGWLKIYCNHLKDDTGLIGATASNQSLYSTTLRDHSWNWNSKVNFSGNIRRYKLLLKSVIYWRFLLNPFPNPHIRTNAFMIRRTDFLSLRKRSLKRKFDAYLFESGKKSLTRQVIKKGYQVVVVGKDMKCYTPDQWKLSNTFWINDQDNLLISDNQTQLYEEADTDYKKYLTRNAWGQE